MAMAILLYPNFFFRVLKDNIWAINSNIRAIKSLNDLFKRLSVAMFPSFNEKLNISLLKNDASLIFTRLVEYILSQILGTAGKKSGWISTKSDWTVSVDSEKLIVAINCVAIKRSVSLAKIWHRGR